MKQGAFIQRLNRPPTVIITNRFIFNEGRDPQSPDSDCPYAGAATGSGGEIRDEGATGIGSKPKAGLVGLAYLT